MFRHILLGSALAISACSAKSEETASTTLDGAGPASSSASTSMTPSPSAPPSSTTSVPGPANTEAEPTQSATPPSTTSPPSDSTTTSMGGSAEVAMTPEVSASTVASEPGPASSDEPSLGGSADTGEPSRVDSGTSESDAGGAPPSSGGCTRDALDAFVYTYLDALAAHDSSSLPLAANVKYTENSHEMTLSEGLWAVAGEAELVRSLIDTFQCSTVTEVVLPEDGVDVVLTLRLTLAAGQLTEAETVITRDGDWLFDAQGYLDSADQKWDVLPEAQRTNREVLIAAAKAYYDEFNDNPDEMGDDPIDIPFDPNDCTRLEGGAATAGCTMGIPDGVPIRDRRYWADEEAGVSVAIALFATLLDVHFYRMISDTIHNVHSMSVQSEDFTTTGWPEGED